MVVFIKSTSGLNLTGDISISGASGHVGFMTRLPKSISFMVIPHGDLVLEHQVITVDQFNYSFG